MPVGMGKYRLTSAPLGDIEGDGLNVSAALTTNLVCNRLQSLFPASDKQQICTGVRERTSNGSTDISTRAGHNGYAPPETEQLVGWMVCRQQRRALLADHRALSQETPIGPTNGISSAAP